MHGSLNPQAFEGQDFISLKVGLLKKHIMGTMGAYIVKD